MSRSNLFAVLINAVLRNGKLHVMNDAPAQPEECKGLKEDNAPIGKKSGSIHQPEYNTIFLALGISLSARMHYIQGRH